MRFRPEAAVRAVSPHLDEVLVSERDLERLLAIAVRLPACALSVGFECRLSTPGPVDLGASVSLGDGGAQVLAGRVVDPALALAVAADASWRHLHEFAAEWTMPATPLVTRVPFLFLEFDADAPVDPVPVPAVFLGLDWPLEELSPSGSALAREGLRAVLDLSERLRGQPLDVDARRRAEQCVAMLPQGGVLLHAGVMLSRPGRRLRLSAVVPRARVTAYLRDIGRADGPSGVAAALERYAGLGGFPHPASHVQLDFEPEGVDERLGVTLRPARSDQWPDLLQLLVDDGLCEGPRRDGLLRWSGASVERLDSEVPRWVVLRAIEHVKLVCKAERTVAAKAYFGATPRLRIGAETMPDQRGG